AGGEDSAGRRGNSIDEHRHHAARRPNRTLIDHSYGLHELLRAGGLIDVSLGSAGECLKNRFLIGAGTGHKNSQVGASSLEAGHGVEDVLRSAVAEQYEVNVLAAGKLRQRGGAELEIRFGIE